MSRIGKQPIPFPETVTVTKNGLVLSVKGPAGELSRTFLDNEIDVKLDGSTVIVSKKKDTVASRALWGTYASHVRNMIQGVQYPFQKKLILEGIGFKSDVSGNMLNLALGFSHPVKVVIPDGIAVKAEKNVITMSSIDKERVGEFAARVRALKKPEPYKGKGFRYDTEVIRRKQGKKSA